ncbi:hypothetical protein B296_00006817, partial [Ensete ventricosum]
PLDPRGVPAAAVLGPLHAPLLVRRLRGCRPHSRRCRPPCIRTGMSAVSRCPAHATDTNKLVIDKGSPGSYIRRRQAARRSGGPSTGHLRPTLPSHLFHSTNMRLARNQSMAIQGDQEPGDQPPKIHSPNPKNQERTRRKPYGDEKDRSQTPGERRKEQRTRIREKPIPPRSAPKQGAKTKNLGQVRVGWDSRSGFLTDSQAKTERFDARREKKESEGEERRDEGWKDVSYHLISNFLLLRTAMDATRRGMGVGDAAARCNVSPVICAPPFISVRSGWGGGVTVAVAVAVASPHPQTWPVRLGVGRSTSESGAARDVGFDPPAMTPPLTPPPSQPTHHICCIPRLRRWPTAYIYHIKI